MPETQNGVIEIVTGDLLRYGQVDFSSDYDPAKESLRLDVPAPAKRRGQPGETQMHRWSGTVWSLVAQPAKQPRFHASSTLISGEKGLTADAGWEVLAGTVTSPTFFVPDVTKILGRCIGQCKATGGAPKMRITELASDGSEVDMTPVPFAIADTGVAWVPFAFYTQVPPRSGTNAYKLEGTKGGGVSVDVRFTSLSLLEIVT